METTPKETRILPEDDAAVLAKAKAVLEKAASRLRALDAVRAGCDSTDPTLRDAENGRKWKEASLELYSLLDELDDAGVSVDFPPEQLRPDETGRTEPPIALTIRA